LVFEEDSTESFEETLKELGALLGFAPQRPEKEFGRGPDVLWEAGERAYFVIECKSGVTSEQAINKHDCNQLNGSIVWFQEKYDSTCQALPLMVHPLSEYEHAASLDSAVRIITRDKLDELRDAVRQFAIAAASGNFGDAEYVRGLLKQFSLTKGDFQKFSVRPKRAR
jgi:hypothetical protein